MIYSAKDDNSGIEKWEAYLIDRLITSKAEEKKLNVLTVRIGLLGP
jgi:hypothetical protein